MAIPGLRPVVIDSLKVLTERGEEVEETAQQQRSHLEQLWGGARGKPSGTEPGCRGSFPRTMVTHCPSRGAELGRGRGSGGQSLGGHHEVIL